MNDLNIYIGWILILVTLSLGGLVYYKIKQKRLKIENRIKSLLETDTLELKDVSIALADLRNGDNMQAYINIRSASMNAPKRKDLKDAIAELEAIMRIKR